LQNLAEKDLWPILAAESLRALAGLGAISLGGRLLLRRIFEVQAQISALLYCREVSKFMICDTIASELLIFSWVCFVVTDSCKLQELRGICCTVSSDSYRDFLPHSKIGLQ
jgi:hypothetical protein